MTCPVWQGGGGGAKDSLQLCSLIGAGFKPLLVVYGIMADLHALICIGTGVLPLGGNAYCGTAGPSGVAVVGVTQVRRAKPPKAIPRAGHRSLWSGRHATLTPVPGIPPEIGEELPALTDTWIREKLKQGSPTKTTGSDDVNFYVLHLCGDDILPWLTGIPPSLYCTQLLARKNAHGRDVCPVRARHPNECSGHPSQCVAPKHHPLL